MIGKTELQLMVPELDRTFSRIVDTSDEKALSETMELLKSKILEHSKKRKETCALCGDSFHDNETNILYLDMYYHKSCLKELISSASE